MRNMCNLYSRYVDDGLIAFKRDGIYEEEEEVNHMEAVKILGNSISPDIRIKMDFPSNNDNGRLPVLDTEIWMEDCEVNRTVKRIIMYSFYEKPMSNIYVVLKRSAMAMFTKINILVNDLFRVMRNVSRLCTDSERISKISSYMSRLEISGYSWRDRVVIFSKAKCKYDKIKQNAERGISPMYRGKFYEKKERMRKKAEKSKTWFGKKVEVSTFFVEATPSSELKKQCQQIIDEVKLPVKILEKSGKSLQKQLVKSNPFHKGKCNDESCNVCKNIGKGGFCKTRELIYKACCSNAVNECPPNDGNYIGRTARSAGERFSEHLKDVLDMKPNSTFVSHMEQHHQWGDKNVSFEILTRCPGDALLRQATEAVMIREMKPGLNRKDELGLNI